MTDYPQAPDGTSAQAFFESMEALGMEYAGATGEGGRFQCPHPGHEDGKPSLDVTIGRKGKPVLNCKPCRLVMEQDEWFADLRDAGVAVAGLPCTDDDIDWGERAQIVGSSSGKHDDSPRVNVKLTEYEYNHADGSPNFKVLRWDYQLEDGSHGKDIRAKHYIAGEGYKWGLPSTVERTPYHVDRFKDWAVKHGDDGTILYVVEGEKTADRLVRAGKFATTFHGGTDAPRPEDWVERYGLDVFTVRVWPDADEAGVIYARKLIKELRAAGVSAEVWGVPAEHLEPKDDAYDVLKKKLGKHVRKLTVTDAKALSALAPAPTRSGVAPAAPEASETLPAPLTVNGKQIVSASLPGGKEPRDGGVPGQRRARPYVSNVNSEQYSFTAELLDRHFRSADGVLVLRFRADDRTFQLWSDRKGRYEHLSDDEVRARVARLLVDAKHTTETGEVQDVRVKPKTWNDLVSCLQLLTLTSEHGAGALLPSIGGVPFRNGWLDAETGELVPIGPERDVRWNVAAEYDPAAECPEWEHFLKTLRWTPDTQEYRLLRMWFGYLLSGSKDQERALLMLGPSRSGKGTVIRVAEALLGEGSAATSLDSLMQNFGLQAFIGKGLATIPDARFGRSDKGLNARLLSLTSNDSLPVDVKYGKPLSLNLPVRLMIATNETPNFIEASDALSRRFMVLKFTESFQGREDRTLFRRLKEELPGIARWSLEGLRDLEDEGKFIETAAGREIQAQMIMESAFVRIFVEEECELGPNFKIPNEELYQEYSIWAEQRKLPVYNSVRFGRELKDAFTGKIEDTRLKIRGKAVRGKIGIRLV